jgi:hypothetical protein
MPPIAEDDVVGGRGDHVAVKHARIFASSIIGDEASALLSQARKSKTIKHIGVVVVRSEDVSSEVT